MNSSGLLNTSPFTLTQCTLKRKIKKCTVRINGYLPSTVRALPTAQARSVDSVNEPQLMSCLSCSCVCSAGQCITTAACDACAILKLHLHFHWVGQGCGRGGAGAEWEDESPVDMHVNICMYM